ncbi:MAG: 50S ribosomal protein L31 [Candidatus Melainabacteria bacterium]|nr:50S ribosomal protein L31 [Candidatus Melainabacteria bacterium]
MKEKIHPEYHNIVATCMCGNEIEIGSTKKEIKVEICSACHPFYTGTQKIIDSEGRVDRFQKRYGKKKK